MRGIFIFKIYGKERHPNFINRLGEKHITNEGYEVEIIEYKTSTDCTFKFNDAQQTIVKGDYKGVRNKWLKNPNHPSVCGVGYYGIGNYSTTGRNVKMVSIWRSLIQRCYSDKAQERQKTYIGVTVCEEWKCFQNFAEWYEENWKPYMNTNWHLDKDILFKGNKIYSPETCCLIPQEINTLFIKCDKVRGKYPIGVVKKGSKYIAQISKNNKRFKSKPFNTPEEAFEVYKKVKEDYIKEFADKWKDKIEPRVYKVMYNYKVEITD